jgi:hypothetical protein
LSVAEEFVQSRSGYIVGLADLAQKYAVRSHSFIV